MGIIRARSRRIVLNATVIQNFYVTDLTSQVEPAKKLSI
jgi:hypothetical protein